MVTALRMLRALKTRRGTPCQAPATSHGRCHKHGEAKGTGAPFGKRRCLGSYNHRFVSGGVYFARLLGISRQHLHDILEENKPLSPAVAVRVAKLFGGGAGIRVRMQASYDTWHAEWEVDVSKIKTLEPA
jgi:addiction module HigA family antidote